MAVNVKHNLSQSAEYINKARNEETEDGDPLKGAAYYLTAMELVMQWANIHGMTLATERERQYFLFQVRQKMEVYAERVHLLLHVAESVGLLDKPTLSNEEVLAQAQASSEAATAEKNGSQLELLPNKKQTCEQPQFDSIWEEPVKPVGNTSDKEKEPENENEHLEKANEQVHEAASINTLPEPFFSPQSNNATNINNNNPVLGIPLNPQSAAKHK